VKVKNKKEDNNVNDSVLTSSDGNSEDWMDANVEDNHGNEKFVGDPAECNNVTTKIQSI